MKKVRLEESTQTQFHYRHKPMCISLANETSTKVIRDVFESLFYEMRIGVLDTWWHTIGDLLPKGTFEVWNGLGHGGEGETSISLAVVPHLVDMSQAKGMLPRLDPRVKVKVYEVDPLACSKCWN